jgi:hypothetical protein
MRNVAGALEVSELATLLVRLEQGVKETAAGFRRGMTMIAVGAVVVAILFVVKGAWFGAGFSLVFGAAIAALGVAASRKTSPERMQPVLDAVRDAPERVTLVRHYETSDSRRIFVKQWIELKTAEHRMVLKAPDWEQLVGYLERQCPQAKLVR